MTRVVIPHEALYGAPPSEAGVMSRWRGDAPKVPARAEADLKNPVDGFDIQQRHYPFAASRVPDGHRMADEPAHSPFWFAELASEPALPPGRGAGFL